VLAQGPAKEIYAAGQAAKNAVVEHIADAAGAQGVAADPGLVADGIGKAGAPQIENLAKIASDAAAAAAPSLSRVALAKVARYAVEGAVLSAPQAVTSAAFKDPQQAAEALAWGAVGNIALGGLGDALSSGASAGARLADKMSEGVLSAQRGPVDDLSRRMALKAMGINRGIARQVGEDKLNEVVDWVFNSGLLGRAKSKDDVARLVGDAVQRSAGDVQKALDALDIAAGPRAEHWADEFPVEPAAQPVKVAEPHAGLKTLPVEPVADEGKAHAGIKTLENPVAAEVPFAPEQQPPAPEAEKTPAAEQPVVVQYDAKGNPVIKQPPRNVFGDAHAGKKTVPLSFEERRAMANKGIEKKIAEIKVDMGSIPANDVSDAVKRHFGTPEPIDNIENLFKGPAKKMGRAKVEALADDFLAKHGFDVEPNPEDALNQANLKEFIPGGKIDKEMSVAADRGYISAHQTEPPVSHRFETEEEPVVAEGEKPAEEVAPVVQERLADYDKMLADIDTKLKDLEPEIKTEIKKYVTARVEEIKAATAHPEEEYVPRKAEPVGGFKADDARYAEIPVDKVSPRGDWLEQPGLRKDVRDELVKKYKADVADKFGLDKRGAVEGKQIIDAAKALPVNPSLSQLNELKTAFVQAGHDDAAQIVDSVMSKEADRIAEGNPALLKQWHDAKMQASASETAAKGVRDYLAQQSGARLVEGNQRFGMSAALFALVTGHPVGAAVAAGGFMANKFLKDRGLVVGANLLRKMSAANTAENGTFGLQLGKHVIDAYKKRLDDLPEVFKTAGKSSTIRQNYSKMLSGQMVQKDRDDLNAHLGSGATDSHSQQLAQVFSNATPNTAAALQRTTSGAVQYLHSQLPVPPREIARVGTVQWQPTVTQQREYLAKKSVVDDPLSVIDRIKDGTLNTAHVDALKKCYPATYAFIAQKTVQWAGQESLSVEKRMLASTLLGTGITPSQKLWGTELTAPGETAPQGPPGGLPSAEQPAQSATKSSSSSPKKMTAGQQKLTISSEMTGLQRAQKGTK
jgi:hypothetical protein